MANRAVAVVVGKVVILVRIQLRIVEVVGAVVADVDGRHPLLLGAPVAERQQVIDFVGPVPGRRGTAWLLADVVLEMTRADGAGDEPLAADGAAGRGHVEAVAVAPERALAALVGEADLLAEVADDAVGRGGGVHPAVRVLLPRPGLLGVTPGAALPTDVILRLDVAIIAGGGAAGADVFGHSVPPVAEAIFVERQVAFRRPGPGGLGLRLGRFGRPRFGQQAVAAVAGADEDERGDEAAAQRPEEERPSGAAVRSLHAQPPKERWFKG